MSIRSVFVTCIAAFALTACLVIAGCGDDDDSASVATTAPAAPLPIEDRVVQGSLGALTNEEPQLAPTPEDFARLVDDDQPVAEAASLSAAGFVAGAVRTAEGENGFALSAAAELGSPEQATAELTRVAGEISTDLPPNAEQGPIAGVPGSRSFAATGMDGGQTFSFGAAGFTDGPFLYVLVAGGPQGAVSSEAVADAARALYDRVEGRPAA